MTLHRAAHLWNVLLTSGLLSRGGQRSLCFLLSLISTNNCVHSIPKTDVVVQSLSWSDSVQPHGLNKDCQAPPSIGFSRQEYWSALPCPPPGDLPNPGIEPMSLISLVLAGKFLTLVPPGKHHQLLLNEGHEEVAHGRLS